MELSNVVVEGLQEEEREERCCLGLSRGTCCWGNHLVIVTRSRFWPIRAPPHRVARGNPTTSHDYELADFPHHRYQTFPADTMCAILRGAKSTAQTLLSRTSIHTSLCASPDGRQFSPPPGKLGSSRPYSRNPEAQKHVSIQRPPRFIRLAKLHSLSV